MVVMVHRVCAQHPLEFGICNFDAVLVEAVRASGFEDEGK
jgi:hypothetical protein